MRKMTRFTLALVLAFCLCLGVAALAADTDAYDIASSYDAANKTITLTGKTDYDRLVARFSGHGKERIYTIDAENGSFTFTFQQGDLPEGEYVGTMQRLGANAHPASFTFVVGEAEKVLERIEMNTLPTKRTYYLRESFSVSGGSINAIYSDGSQEEIELTPAMCSEVNMNTTGTKTVTVTYGGQTTSFDITVRIRNSGGNPNGGRDPIITVPTCTQIAMAQLPTKTSYQVGEAFSAEGGSITAYYSNGTDKEVTLTEAMCSVPDMSTEGSKTVTVTYSGQTTSFDITVSSSGTGFENPFTDIDNHWAKDNILFVVERNLFMGMSETEFGPDGEMTRGMFVTVLGRLAGVDVSGLTCTFTDVNPDLYYAPYIAFAQQNGIVLGISETEFAPDRSISREEMSKIVYNYCVYAGISLPAMSEEKYADDSQINDWAKEPVYTMTAMGLLSGKEDNYFDPQGKTTRAEVATVLRRFVEQYQ